MNLLTGSTQSQHCLIMTEIPVVPDHYDCGSDLGGGAVADAAAPPPAAAACSDCASLSCAVCRC